MLSPSLCNFLIKYKGWDMDLGIVQEQINGEVDFSLHYAFHSPAFTLLSLDSGYEELLVGNYPLL